MKVVGVDKDGCLICEVVSSGKDLPIGSRYNCGGTLKQFGQEFLTHEELATLGLS